MSDEILKDQKRQLEHVEKVIRAIEAAIERRATQTHLSLEIQTGSGTRKISETPIAELIVIRDRYMVELKKLRMAQGKLSLPKGIVFRFRG